MCLAARQAAISRNLSLAVIRRDPDEVDGRGEGARACPAISELLCRALASEWEAICGFGRSAHVPGRSTGGHQQAPCSSTDPSRSGEGRPAGRRGRARPAISVSIEWGARCGCGMIELVPGQSIYGHQQERISSSDPSRFGQGRSAGSRRPRSSGFGQANEKPDAGLEGVRVRMSPAARLAASMSLSRAAIRPRSIGWRARASGHLWIAMPSGGERMGSPVRV